MYRTTNRGWVAGRIFQRECNYFTDECDWESPMPCFDGTECPVLTTCMPQMTSALNVRFPMDRATLAGLVRELDQRLAEGQGYWVSVSVGTTADYETAVRTLDDVLTRKGS
jgi:hypothetical protein